MAWTIVLNAYQQIRLSILEIKLTYLEEQLMKNIKLFGVVLFSTTVLGILTSGVLASAAEVSGQTGETPATVIIKDSTDDPDPLDPSDLAQTHLLLTAVPSSYNYESELKNNGTYSIKGTVTGDNQSISVFNDRSSREWSVKATVQNNHLTMGTSTFDVSNLTINSTELVGTGVDGIVAKNSDTTTANNTGTINTPVTTTSIDFSDPGSVLKAGDTLSGIVNYQLYNTSDAS